MNIATLITAQAQRLPHKRAVVLARRKGRGYEYPCYTFSQFETRSNQIACRLQKSGVAPGMRVLLFVKPSLDFSVITFALFKLGAIPVLIDPGMGKENLLRAIAEVKPSAMVAETIVHWVAFLERAVFGTVKIRFKVSQLLAGAEGESKTFETFEAQASEPAAILFTSGGTGTPKGVITTHEILHAQTRMLQEMFQLNEKHVDLPGFPLFALFTLAMGMTSVVPDMDPTRPAECDPAKIVRTILEQQVTFAAGSPAIWERVGQYCVAKKIQLPSLKTIAMFGAPVRGEVHQLFRTVLPFGQTHTPYGATECLPISTISGSEVLRETWAQTLNGFGTCVGSAVAGNKISIRKVADIPDGFPSGVGEILVQGPTVTPGYFERPAETENAKIQDPAGLIHRMGDVGHIDGTGKLWFCGRLAHVVSTATESFYPIPVEAIFNQHPTVKRAALVKLQKNGAVFPGIVVELKPKAKPDLLALQRLAASFEHTKAIQHFFVHPGFPVDVRHNIKIDRLKLAQWAQGQGV